MPRSWRCAFLAVAATTAACSDTAPPEPEVASIVLSIADTGATIRFRDPLIVRASPQAALGVPLARAVTWSSVTPSLLTVQPLNANGDSARIQAAGVGRGDVRVSAGGQTRTFPVTVKDTVFSVTLTPAAVSLVVGDTMSFVARVAGPPNAEKAVEWIVTNATVLHAVSTPDSSVRRLQVMASGAVNVRVTALADPTKSATAAVTAQAGKLAFFTQPATTAREIPINPPLAVVVQDPSGNVSLRAANAVTLSAIPSACGASLKGVVTVVATNGVAEFPSTTVSARCSALTLSATANPPASSATSQAFNVTARGCNAVAPIGLIDTVSAVMEGADCIVMRGTVAYHTHTYFVTVPVAGIPGQLNVHARLSVDATASGFAPRIESRIWSGDTAVFWTDSLRTRGTLTSWYLLGPGSYRLSVTTAAQVGSEAYTIVSGTFPAGGGQTGLGPCRIAITPEISFFGSPGPDCGFGLASRPGQSIGRAYLLYLPPGKAVTVTNRPFTPADDMYLEVFDVTNPASGPTLIAFDDNSGGGVGGRDAQVRLNGAPTGRFVEIRALFLVATNTVAAFNLTISP